MGMFKVMKVAHPLADAAGDVTALVDTGAVYSVIPDAVLRSLNIEPTEEMEFTLADDTSRVYGVGEARFGIDDRERTTPVIFGPENTCILGAVTLQSFGLVPDTTHHRLIPARLLLVGVRQGMIVPGIPASESRAKVQPLGTT